MKPTTEKKKHANVKKKPATEKKNPATEKKKRAAEKKKPSAEKNATDSIMKFLEDFGISGSGGHNITVTKKIVRR